VSCDLEFQTEDGDLLLKYTGYLKVDDLKDDSRTLFYSTGDPNEYCYYEEALQGCEYLERPHSQEYQVLVQYGLSRLFLSTLLDQDLQGDQLGTNST